MTPKPWLFAAEPVRTLFEWGRIQSNADWILPVAACVAMLVFAVWLYRRDAAELGLPARVALTLLRALVIFGVLLVYLEPQWRVERDVVRNSRVVLLVDTSLSMGLPDQEQTSIAGGPSRSDRVIRALAETELLAQLRKTHDVAVVHFDQQTGAVVQLEKLAAQPTGDAAGATPATPPTAGAPPDAAATIDWPQALAPRGGETRLGQALRQVVLDERAGPISGVVVVTDGGQNAGVGPAPAVQAAQDAGIPIYTVGLGSARQPTNVRIGDLLAPARAYPGDNYQATGYVQAQGMANRVVTVELYSRPAESATGAASQANTAASKLEGSAEVTLGPDGEAVPVKFELTPDETGRRTLSLRVKAPNDDGNPTDNQQEVDVEIVDRKTRILLFASGPSREYRFLHTFLFRDRNVLVDILLQTAQGAVSQEANEVLAEFPATREALDKYDVIVAFDPDWKQLSNVEVDNLERWVGEQAGG
ncbi:MAG: VWA domain-containing protein, partial [Planctomycetaceae bacterium]|nr:VWA domain-containing protein [Planctomycetaceae bacterium]